MPPHAPRRGEEGQRGLSEADPIRFGPSPSPAEAQEPTPAPAWAYLLRCPDGSLYGGWSNGLARR